MRCIKLMIAALIVAICSVPTHAIDAGVDGDWLGDFCLSGGPTAKCANVTPHYIRVNMSDSYWKDMYALNLFAAS